MLFAGFVIQQHALLQRVGDDRLGDLAAFARDLRRYLQRVVGGARITAGIGGDFVQHRVPRGEIYLSQSTLRICERSL